MNLLDIMSENLKKYKTAILRLVGEGNPSEADIYSVVAGSDEELASRALLSLPKLVKESVNMYNIPREERIEEADSSPAPILKMDNKDGTENDVGGVLAEGTVLCSVGGVVQSVAVWIALYFVFNMAYSKTAKKTLTFIERVLVGLKSKTKIGLSIYKLKEKLDEICSQLALADSATA